MENPFRVGDIVKILPKNISQKYYPTYADGMQKYAGQLAIIVNVDKYSCKIDLDNSSYYWPFSALQLVTSETDETVDLYNLKNGDYIKLTSTLNKSISLIYLFREVKDNAIYKHASYSLISKNIDVTPDKRWLLTRYTKITYATEEEKKLLDEALLREGYKWNVLTKQLDSIGLVDISTNNLFVEPIHSSPSFYASIQRIRDVSTNTLNDTKEETQTETELNLFPKKKHYQLNFNY